MHEKEINIAFTILFLVAILVALSIVVLFVIFNSRKNTLIQKYLKEELEHQKQLHKIELNALRSQMNPHFVHNSLNAIQYYIQRHEVEISENYLTKFSKLMRLFFEYSRRQTITVSEEVVLLNNYLEIEKLRFEDKLEFTIKVDEALDAESQQIPSMILQPIVENAINHGIFHKQEKGKVNVDFIKVSSSCYKVIIVDDGIGINKSKLMTRCATKKKECSSYVLEKRLMLLKKSNLFDIEYTLKDRLDFSDNEGTEVILQITEKENV